MMNVFTIAKESHVEAFIFRAGRCRRVGRMRRRSGRTFSANPGSKPGVQAFVHYRGASDRQSRAQKEMRLI
jgi:hypothetical protein